MRKKLSKQKVGEVIEILENHYGDEGCGLDFRTPYELLVATILSAQCTDVRVNIVTDELFKDYNTPQKMLTLSQQKLQKQIRSCGLSKTKSKNILATSRILLQVFDGEVPKTMEELIELPGVGRKTANVVMSNAFGADAIAVDTHVFRVSKRIGLATGNNVLQVEKELMAILPKSYWSRAHHWIIWHGRRLCKARNPECPECPLREICLYKDKTVDETS